MYKKGKFVAIIVIALLLSITSYAFAATNTVPATNAGDGSASISGYSITSVSYTLLSADNSKIDTVTFKIAPITATSVKIRLVSTSSSWFPCNNASGTVTCTVNGGATVLAADVLQVIAVQ
jgi:hypothetical protein